MRRVTPWIILLIFVTLTACGGKKEIKRPSPEAEMIKRAFLVAEKIKNAYLRKDRDTLKRYCSRNGYLTIISSMKDFDSATLNFQLRWADIKRDKIILYIYWRGSWLLKGRLYKDSGLTAFAFTGSPPMLSDILRANPFSQPQ